MTEPHDHTWQTVGEPRLEHQEGHKYLTFYYRQICDCGLYREKKFINELETLDSNA